MTVVEHECVCVCVCAWSVVYYYVYFISAASYTVTSALSNKSAIVLCVCVCVCVRKLEHVVQPTHTLVSVNVVDFYILDISLPFSDSLGLPFL